MTTKPWASSGSSAGPQPRCHGRPSIVADQQPRAGAWTCTSTVSVGSSGSGAGSGSGSARSGSGSGSGTGSGSGAGSGSGTGSALGREGDVRVHDRRCGLGLFVGGLHGLQPEHAEEDEKRHDTLRPMVRITPRIRVEASGYAPKPMGRPLRELELKGFGRLITAYEVRGVR